MKRPQPTPEPEVGDQPRDGDELLPYNHDAEAGVLGSILIASDAICDVADWLRPDDFHMEAYRTIYAAALALYAAGKPADIITLCDELKRRGTLEEVGGDSEVSRLANNVPSSINLRHYAGIVARTAAARRVIDAATEITAAAYADNHADLDGFVEWAANRIRDTIEGPSAASKKAPYHLLSVREVLNQPRPDPLIDHHYSLDSTGLTFAPPGVGKTVLLLDQMAHVALDRAWEGHAVKGGHVVYVCAEGQAFLPERLQALMLKLGVKDIPRLHILAARPQLLKPQTVAQLLKTFAAELPEHPVWIAFDTVSQTAAGARENDADAMGPYLAAMERIREATHAFVHAIHHTGKDESRGARGSSVFDGNCDTVTSITKSDGTCAWKCHKQRGGWKPFAPFTFRVKSLAFDDHADRTGPVIETCDAPAEPTQEPPAPKGQALKVYTIFQELARQHERNDLAPIGAKSDGGVYYSTWQKACAEQDIAKSTFKDALGRLAHLVYKPEGSDKYCLAPRDGQAEGQEGQNGANVGPKLALIAGGRNEGQQGQPPLERLALLAQPESEQPSAMNGRGGSPDGGAA